MYGVERLEVIENHSTYEIFSSLKDALAFAEELKVWKGVYIPLYIFRAYFNKERIYFEGRSWYYEDFSDTIVSTTEILIEFNDPKRDSFEIKKDLWEKIEKMDNTDEVKSLFKFPDNCKKLRRKILHKSTEIYL